MGKRAIAIALLLPGGASASTEPLHLICAGSGSGIVSSTTSVRSNDADGNAVTTSAVGTQSVSFEDQIAVDIDGETGRIAAICRSTLHFSCTSESQSTLKC